MCLAVPGKIVEVHETMATVDIAGNKRQVSLILTPEAQLGDYVLIHAGFAIQMIDEKEAQETLALFEEWAEKERQLEEGLG
ncbi:MAG: HypC/HybG/HupF family hydrogenase formation chaperone [Syntrophomonadaceae bacterium]|nr:HypC/HybG/HupF family hydrogenase formation chaperone [Syntrophomonadaceae bacterium]